MSGRGKQDKTVQYMREGGLKRWLRERRLKRCDGGGKGREGREGVLCKGCSVLVTTYMYMETHSKRQGKVNNYARRQLLFSQEKK